MHALIYKTTTIILSKIPGENIDPFMDSESHSLYIAGNIKFVLMDISDGARQGNGKDKKPVFSVMQKLIQTYIPEGACVCVCFQPGQQTPFQK